MLRLRWKKNVRKEKKKENIKRIKEKNRERKNVWKASSVESSEKEKAKAQIRQRPV